MKKRIIKALAASALFAGMLAGCGAEGGSGSSGDTIKIGWHLS